MKSPGKLSQAIRFRLLLIGDMTRGLTTFAGQRLGGFGCLVLHAARAPVLFIFEPSDVFLGIGEALQACVEDGGIGNLM